MANYSLILEKIESIVEKAFIELKKNREQLEKELITGISSEFESLRSSLESSDANSYLNETVNVNPFSNPTENLNSSDLETKPYQSSTCFTKIDLTSEDDEESIVSVQPPIDQLQQQGGANFKGSMLPEISKSSMLREKNQVSLVPSTESCNEKLKGQWEVIIWNHNLSPPLFDTGQIKPQIDKENDCSLCRKKNGHAPTGILVRTAKENGSILSLSEHQELISQMKKEASLAHAEMLEAMELVAPKRIERSDALRTDPLFLDENGRAFWRLKGHKDLTNILLQDMGVWDSVPVEEKWFVYSAEQKEEIEKYISSLRRKRLRVQEAAGIRLVGDYEAN